MRIGTSEQVAVFLENERRVELRGSSDDELRSWSHRMQQRARSETCERLSRATVRTEDIIGSNAATAETAVDRLHLHCLTTEHRRRHSVAHSSRHQLLEMNRELISQFARRSETIFGLVLDRAHQDHLHLRRERGRDLARSRVLREIENQQRIVL